MKCICKHICQFSVFVYPQQKSAAPTVPQRSSQISTEEKPQQKHSKTGTCATRGRGLESGAGACARVCIRECAFACRRVTEAPPPIHTRQPDRRARGWEGRQGRRTWAALPGDTWRSVEVWGCYGGEWGAPGLLAPGAEVRDTAHHENCPVPVSSQAPPCLSVPFSSGHGPGVRAALLTSLHLSHLRGDLSLNRHVPRPGGEDFNAHIAGNAGQPGVDAKAE